MMDKQVSLSSSSNKLFYGDNLFILREHIPNESVDLIYLDPPFNSNRNYNVLFKDEHGSDSEAQIKAFDDSWRWGFEAENTYTELLTETPSHVAKMIESMRDFIGSNQMMAYLVMMTVRLIELDRVLKTTGSLYLHCDPTASHYLKIILDTIFGIKNFRNEIVWCYDTGGRSKSYFPKKHDVIFWYSKSDKYTFNYDAVSLKRDTSTMHEPILHDEQNRPYQRNIKFGKEYRYYLDKGVLPNDWWTDIQALNPASKERLGYPTQKPLLLLERIINASSNPGDIVLDPFCGCGTAVVTAEKLKRKWIGVDITHLGITAMKYRLKESLPGIPFKVIGEPTDLGAAHQLASEDRYQFQWWALSLIPGAMPLGGQEGSREGKKGSDKGIDGILTFIDDSSAKAKRALIQVKSGHVNSSMIRDLIGTVQREQATLGVFVTLEEPTKDMVVEAITAGFYNSPGWKKKYPIIQIYTIDELLHKAEVNMPSRYWWGKKAKVLKSFGEQKVLDLMPKINRGSKPRIKIV